jgi:molybdenum cofactor guanylyltransferase
MSRQTAILGVVLAGGQSQRFGSDKGLAMLQGKPLLQHAIDSLAQWCSEIVVVGRDDAPVQTLADWPKSGMGPLAGLAAALRFAKMKNFPSVLSCGVDSLALPKNLPELLSPPPSYLISQPVVGHWPSDVADKLKLFLGRSTRHSMIAFAEHIEAAAISVEIAPYNINTVADLANAAESMRKTDDGL